METFFLHNVISNSQIYNLSFDFKKYVHKYDCLFAIYESLVSYKIFVWHLEIENKFYKFKEFH